MPRVTCPSCHQQFTTFRPTVETCPLCGGALAAGPAEAAGPAAQSPARPRLLAARPGVGYVLSCLWLVLVGAMMFVAWIDLWGFSTEPLDPWRGRAALAITALGWVLAGMAVLGLWAMEDWGRWLGIIAMVLTGAVFIAQGARGPKAASRGIVLGVLLTLANLAVIYYLVGPAARLFGKPSGAGPTAEPPKAPRPD